MKRNVLELYTSLVRLYRPGDRIYLFGFSRGAYTVRTLSELIQHCGVIDFDKICNSEHLKKLINICWKSYKLDVRNRCGLSLFSSIRNKKESLNELDSNYLHSNSKNIHFIGVWDTVSAIIPIPGIPDLINKFYPFRYPDCDPGQKVSFARHALAIDDERKSFHPELWKESVKDPGRHLKQVWFAGSHSNVGGGYKKHGMSLVALDWMMEEATDAGLVFIRTARSYVHDQMNVHDKLYDSRSGIHLFYLWNPRNIAKLCEDNNINVPVIHESVIERILSSTEGYRPGNLPYKFEIEPTKRRANNASETRFSEMILEFKAEHSAKMLVTKE